MLLTIGLFLLTLVLSRPSKLIEVQNKLDQSPTPDLQDQDKFLSHQYLYLLHLEESIWAQRSRAQWLSQGDQNTRFFHAATIQKRAL